MFEVDKGIQPYWFIGQVVDNNDFANGARVKVRCLGIHPDEPGTDPSEPNDKTEKDSVYDEDLPWAHLISGTYGKLEMVPDLGDWVFGFFADGRDCQHPFVLGLVSGMGTDVSGLSPECAPGAPNARPFSPDSDGRNFGTGECYITSVSPPATSDSLTPEYRGLLSTIASYEQGSGGYSGYYRNAITLDLNSGHPNTRIPIPGSSLGSSAAGRYQFIGSTWISVNGGRNLPMTPENQDAAAIRYAELIARNYFGINDLQSYLETNGMDDTVISVLGHSSGWEAFRKKKPECFQSIYNQYARPSGSVNGTTGGGVI